MSAAARAARLLEAVLRVHGENADWEGVGIVRVIARERDVNAGFDYGASIATARFVRVRRAEVASPEEGQIVQLLDEAGAPDPERRFAVVGEPMLDRKRVWTCTVEPAPLPPPPPPPEE
ncbi:MAG: hypothetical protein ACK4K7_03065 [Allosphingosinicella sp.]|uniref:head-tail joining protein n=1 Tax=Allosphingosinicella sp. TaxID=2823234 RepID=UPI00392913F1